MFRTTSLLYLLASAAQADVSARFIEGAPTDRFEFTATSSCIEGPATLVLDLTGSAGKLIFDVTASGRGVEVFQPLTLTSGGGLVSQMSNIEDGGRQLALTLNAWPQGAPVAFTLDLDDTLGGREITVSGAEIAGATLSFTQAERTSRARFDKTARAQLPQTPCNS